MCPVCLMRGRFDRRLSVTFGPDRVRIHCFGHCDRRDVLAVLGLNQVWTRGSVWEAWAS